ncbi:MAG: hypothetical protein M1834_000479 [Cirrosporium novae-zelandiae]|nr:MAG: hypothetical protein M1834_000479 [Cirrosporium novae-zelandiae]
MSGLDRARRRLFYFVTLIGISIIITNLFLLLSPTDLRSQINQLPIPGRPKGSETPPWQDDTNWDNYQEAVDEHPIATLMKEADDRWRIYDESRSLTFKETVTKYRRKYGRHPPPGFKEWYRFARAKNVYNIDDFDQIMDDLRPFWAIEPRVIRSLAAHMWEKEEDGISGIHIRNHKIWNITNPSWRSETMADMIKQFIKYIPDLDIAMNRLDQPRVVVSWEEMQDMLSKEAETRAIPPEVHDEFTPDMQGLFDGKLSTDENREDPGWYPAHGKQYMNIASTACPPESPARKYDKSTEDAEAMYKDALGGLITNFNRSTDLCTVGPAIKDLHGFLYSSSTVIATKRLVPVFGECKVNVNSDILFPANMYWRHDDRYDYNGKYDVSWDDKSDVMVWRGVTSGGVQVEDNWRRMHRQRLVMYLNGTEMADKEVRVLTAKADEKGSYEPFDRFQPSKFATDHTDVGFVETWGCVPDCSFYKDVFSLKPQTTLSQQFKYKYLVDVDGHSFSGRWRAFLESKALGIKATIFREWHDSRLFAWRHFVPMDNRFDDVYALLTYFIGVGKPGLQVPSEMEAHENYINGDVYVPRHDYEASRIARQGREWANMVLRRDDILVYMFRLMLEYARIVDDNRDRIGYSGDGSEMDKFDGKSADKAGHRRWVA